MGFEWSKKRVRESKKATGLSGEEIRRIAQDLGIKNFNSKNERKRVVARARENQVQSAYQDVLGRDPDAGGQQHYICLLYTSPSPRDQRGSRMPSSA